MKFGGGIKEQGMPWEDYLAKQLEEGTRLPAGFKTFDFFDRMSGKATSAKTMNTLTISKLAKPEQIRYTLKGYIDKTALSETFPDARYNLTNEMIKSRTINLAIPSDTTTAQYAEIKKAIEYAKSQNIELNITRVK